MNVGAVPLPAIFLLCACALLAVAIFAPRKPIVPAVSYAPPAVERAAEAIAERYETCAPQPAIEAPLPHEAEPALAETEWAWAPPPADDRAVMWPELVDPKAAGIDATARIAIVTALATVRAAWAEAILERATRDETDPGVLAVLESVRGDQRRDEARLDGAYA